MYLAKIPLTEIIVEDRVRKDLGDMPAFMTTFEEFGQLQTITVLKQVDGTFKLLAGGRRYAALTLKNFESANCTVLEGLSDLQGRKIELYENIHRKSLDHIEEANAIREIHELYMVELGQGSMDGTSWNQKKTGELLRVDQKTISNALVLSEGAAFIPDLKKTKNKTEAMRVIRGVKTEAIRQELSRRTTAAQSEGKEGIDEAKDKLAKCYIVGDCMDPENGLPSLPDNIFDFFNLDPPWGIDYASLGASEYKEGYEDKAVDYIPRLQALLPHVFRTLKDKRWIVFWCAEDFTRETKMLLEQVGFNVAPIPLVWKKMGQQGANRQPEQILTSNYERAIYARKGDAVLTKPSLNTFDFIRKTGNIHPSEKPVELEQILLATFSLVGYRVCIPFLGSGNGLFAANSCGMPAFGYDLSDTYRGGFLQRLQTFPAQLV